ncbi:uncharacterized conserved protein [Sanguibacter keddieii DSM 10542]|uniref:Uncharacterized conserved protein n=1 Tax=Sanguibacter keddieii (strain ATCC 51767 / DSM 10542 / NCFB 3025 / ST-74) TaxID=446469 RepID=D1BFJ4_SANKS|nr:HdeD family acid-resistance protein [Sanguibacter keddieii]ACZ23497.1 uncharacterized conserved protein [Sanguibacter keddieii DSM 10542]
MPETILPTFSSLARHVWHWTVVRGVLAIIFGVVALVAPISTAVSLAVVVAVFAVVDGIFEIVDGIRHRGAGGAGLRILQGALTLAFGVVLVVWPSITALAIVWTIGLWAVVVGIIQVVVALSLRKVERSGWGWGVVSGLVSVIFGVLLLARPGAGLVSIIWVLGVYAIMLGVLLVGFGLQVRRLGKEAGAVAGETRDEHGARDTTSAPHPDRSAAHLAPESTATASASERAADHVPSHLAAPSEPEPTKPDAPA